MAAIFNVVLPEPGDAIVAEEKVALTPEGIPDTLKATAELIPLVVVFTEAVLVWPCATLAAYVEIVKDPLGAAASFQWFTKLLASTDPNPVA